MNLREKSIMKVIGGGGDSKESTFSALVSFLDTSPWIHSCSLEPMMATPGLGMEHKESSSISGTNR